jgi:hypothetical protein
MTRLTDRRNRICLDAGVYRCQRQPVLDGLTDQEPVERITMEERQLRQMKYCRFVYIKTWYLVQPSLFGKVEIRRAWERQFANLPLDDSFPG